MTYHVSKLLASASLKRMTLINKFYKKITFLMFKHNQTSH